MFSHVYHYYQTYLKPNPKCSFSLVQWDEQSILLTPAYCLFRGLLCGPQRALVSSEKSEIYSDFVRMSRFANWAGNLRSAKSVLICFGSTLAEVQEYNCLPWSSSAFPLPISDGAKISRGAEIEGMTLSLQSPEVRNPVSVWCPNLENSLIYTRKKSYWIQDTIFMKTVYKTQAQTRDLTNCSSRPERLDFSLSEREVPVGLLAYDIKQNVLCLITMIRDTRALFSVSRASSQRTCPPALLPAEFPSLGSFKGFNILFI